MLGFHSDRDHQIIGKLVDLNSQTGELFQLKYLNSPKLNAQNLSKAPFRTLNVFVTRNGMRSAPGLASGHLFQHESGPSGATGSIPIEGGVISGSRSKSIPTKNGCFRKDV
jgi:hypothetical protein